MLNGSGCLSVCVYVVGEHWNRRLEHGALGEEKEEQKDRRMECGTEQF